MAAVFKTRVEKELERQVTQIISGAIQALEEGQSIAYARAQLKEVNRKLQQLEFEFRGGCSW